MTDTKDSLLREMRKKLADEVEYLDDERYESQWSKEYKAIIRRIDALLASQTVHEIKPVAVKIFNQYGGSTWEDLPPDTAGEHELLMSDRHVLLYDSAALAAARREGEIAGILIGEVTGSGVIWHNKNPHAHPVGTKFYAINRAIQEKSK